MYPENGIKINSWVRLCLIQTYPDTGNDEGHLLLVPRGIYYFHAKRPISHFFTI